MSLSGSHVVGDAGHTDDHNALDALINNHTSSLNTLSSNVATNTTAISNHATSINTLNTNVAQNTSDIASHASSISTLNSNLTTANSNIASNTNAISTNSANITTNTNAISSLNSQMANTVSMTQFQATASLSPSSLYVSTTGSDTNGGTATSPFRTIKKAIQTATAGTTIFVKGGTYTEDIRNSGSSLVPNKGTKSNPITLRCFPGDTVYFQGLLWLNGADYWIIDGINATWSDTISTDYTAHMWKMTDGIGWIIQNCELHHTKSYACLLIASGTSGLPDGYIVRNNYFHDGANQFDATFTDGVGSQGSTTFTSATANFTSADVSQYLYTSTTANASYTDGVSTSGSATFTSSTANFVTADIGKTLTATGIPAGATIKTINSSTSVVLSANATATGSALSFTIGNRVITQSGNIINSVTNATTVVMAYPLQAPASNATFNVGGRGPHGVNQDHHIYANLNLTAGIGVIERNLFVNAPNGENVKIAGVGTAGTGSSQVILRYNTMVGARDQNVLVGNATNNVLIYRNLIGVVGFVGQSGRLIRGYQLNGLGNKAWKNAGWGAQSGYTFLNDTGSDSSGTYVGITVGGGNLYGTDPSFNSTSTGYAGYIPTVGYLTAYGHAAPTGLNDTPDNLYTVDARPLTALEQQFMSGTVASVQDDVDSPDSNWLVATSNTAVVRFRCNFPTPPATLDPGDSLQQFRCQVRKTAASGTSNPYMALHLYENGVFLQSLGQVQITSTTGVVYTSQKWSTSVLSDPTGSKVECRFVVTPGADSTLDLGALEWNAVYNDAQASTSQFVPLALTTAKGDLLVGKAPQTPKTLTVGADGSVLTADSTQVLGVKWAAAGAGTTYTNDTPSRHSLKEWNYHPDISTSSQGLTSGTCYMMKVTATANATITNVVLNCTSPGATLTAGQSLVAVYDNTGARLGISADQSANWTSVGVKTVPMTATFSITSGSDYYVVVMCNGTTPAGFQRGPNSIQGANAGLSSGTYRFSVIATAQTALPASFTMTNQVQTNAFGCWVAFS